MKSSKKSVDVCLLTGTRKLPEWFVTAIQTMLEETSADLQLVVLKSESKKQETGGGMRRAIRLPLVAAKAPLKRNPQRQWSLTEVEWFSDQPLVECEPILVDSYRLAVPPETVETITESCDVVIHFGFGILSGKILSQPSYGVLSFHHGDVREYRGAPAGFWEFVNGDYEIGVTLQQLTETLDGGEIVAIKTVDISNAPFLAEVRKRVTEASSGMLAEAIQQIEDSTFQTDTLTDDELGDLYTRSDVQLAEKAKYVLKTVENVLNYPLLSAQIYARNFKFLVENRGP